MSSGKLDKYSQESMVRPYKIIFERKIDISQLVIPFSKMFKSYKQKDIYSGGEKIPFKERDPEFKTILKHEFANFI